MLKNAAMNEVSNNLSLTAHQFWEISSCLGIHSVLLLLWWRIEFVMWLQKFHFIIELLFSLRWYSLWKIRQYQGLEKLLERWMSFALLTFSESKRSHFYDSGRNALKYSVCNERLFASVSFILFMCLNSSIILYFELETI